MKTTNHISRVFVLLFVMASIAACSNKDDDNPPPEPTVAELLAHKWFFTKRDNNGTVTLANACSGQTYFDFRSDGTLIFQEFDLDSNGNCSTGPAQAYEYTLSADETQIISTWWPAGTTLTLTIVTLNTTTLAVDFSSGDIYSFKR
jgi:hypothetical protein